MDVWLRIVKLFELELSARKIAIQTGLAYNTVHKALMTLRHSILAHANDGERIIFSGEIELDESYFGGRRKGTVVVGRKARFPFWNTFSQGSSFRFHGSRCQRRNPLDLTVKMVRRGSIVYTDKYKAYDSLMFCGYRHLSVDHSSKFSDGKVHINGLEGFGAGPRNAYSNIMAFPSVVSFVFERVGIPL